MSMKFTAPVLVMAPLLLASCASLNPDAALAPVAHNIQTALKQPLQWTRSDADQQRIDAQVQALLQAPLSADAAVRIALLNNPALQADLEALAVVDADRVQAATLPNPALSLARLRQGSSTEWDRSLQLDLAGVLTMPLAQRIAALRLEQTQADVTLRALQLAHAVRRAYYAALAAEQGLALSEQVHTAAQASAELAQRMRQAGNWSALQQAREQMVLAEAALALAGALQRRLSSREALLLLLGLATDPARLVLPPTLPDLPERLEDTPDMMQVALERRLDVVAAKQANVRLAGELGASRIVGLVNVLELGVLRNSHSDAASEHGVELRLELPLFDWGQARQAKAQARYREALQRTAQTALNARSQIRQAQASVRSSYQIARQWRDQIVPLKQRISEENLLRYNGMLIGVFELLADSRAQLASRIGAIEAQRDYWLAQADLDMATLGPIKPGTPTPQGDATSPASDNPHH